MSTLEVLQNCPTQRKNPLIALGALDPDNTNLIHFNVENYKSRLPHQLAFHISSRVVGRKVHQTVLDEGALTSVFSIAFCRAIGSVEVMKLPTTLKYFDVRGLQPRGLFSALSVELGGKTVSIQVEVVDAPLDYNILLGRNWFYAMTVVASTVFKTLQFQHMGNIVPIDQLEYCTPDVTTPMVNNIPMLGQSHPPYELIRVVC